jgi:DNA-binding Lrp family transcriptional regulator
MVVDDTDRRMLAVLQDDGRISVNELAGRVNISRATAYQRLERLRAEGVITRFTAVVDPAKVGLGITALILLNIEQHAWRSLRHRLQSLAGVHYLALTSGGFDIVILVRVDSIETLRDVVLNGLQGMAEVRSTQTIFVLDEHGEPM